VFDQLEEGSLPLSDYHPLIQEIARATKEQNHELEDMRKEQLAVLVNPQQSAFEELLMKQETFKRKVTEEANNLYVCFHLFLSYFFLYM